MNATRSPAESFLPRKETSKEREDSSERIKVCTHFSLLIEIRGEEFLFVRLELADILLDVG